MERVQVLIDKLVRQRQQNESIDQMLATVQLLQSELHLLKRKKETSGSSKIAVIMPSRGGATAVPVAEKKAVIERKQDVPEVVPQPVEETQTEQEDHAQPVLLQPEPAHEQPVVQEPKKVEDSPKKEEYFLQKPNIAETEPAPQPLPEVEQPPKSVPVVAEPPVSVPQPGPVHNVPYDLFHGHFDAVTETPTLIQQEPQKEIHELISEPQESLNDRLKEEKTELAHKLKDTPIKDLRKAIGVNDKYVFVNELFRGDEAMYERSIKTINGFHILQEAEYWINRELKFKLGWSDQKETVQYFYHLVRRRFS